MKALQQAAQNRSGRLPASPESSPEASPAPGAGSDPPAGSGAPDGAGPVAHAGDAGSGASPAAAREFDLAALSLEPIDRAAAERSPGAGVPRDDFASAAAGSQGPVRAPGPPRAGGSPPAASRPPAARAAGGGPSDRRSAPRWSGDLQDGDRAAGSDATGAAADDLRSGERQRRRGQDRSDPSRAGAVLAAGAGAARAGALSRVTRMQWIIAGGSLAGVLLVAYFYIQISYPGLLQRGFRQPALSSPLASRTPPPPAATAAPSASGTIDPGGNAQAGQPMPGTTAAQPAPAPDAGPQQGTLPMTGVGPAISRGPDNDTGPAAATPSATAPAGVPAALAASPLLNPPAGAEPGGPAPATIRAAPAGNAAAAPGLPPGRTAAPAAAPQATGTPTTPSGAPTSTPPSAGSTAPAAAAPPPSAAAATAGVPRSVAPPSRTPAPAPAGEGIRVTRGSTANPVNPALADAYDHMQAGRIESAQRLYEQVAAADPRNVDALLGMGAVAQLGNQVEVASRLYMRVLEIEPRNAHAQAALIGQLGRADPVAAESQLKTLIAREPSPFLYFTLGNLLADQNRWAQAQQAWFQAHHLQPGNADYAFNLAVSLERISQPRLAIDYLRTAIRLAEAGARANFDVAAARKRVALLESANRAP